MSRSRELCTVSARRHGVDTVFDWRLDELHNTKIYREHGKLFDKPRGVGYWAWKPFIILDRICQLFDGPNPNHVVVYADVGVEFINNVNYIIDRMDQDIFLFGNNWEHAHWCKRDIIEALWPDVPKMTYALPKELLRPEHSDPFFTMGKQCQASVIFFRVSDYSRKFVKEWLNWCLFEGGRLIDDSPSRAPNHPEFRENRHDQAILTTMAYREGIKLHWWPAVYNRGSSPEFVYEKLLEYAGDTYPALFSHHRTRNHEWSNVA